ncbi:hypothetical protein [Rhodopirellula sallentina]|uniref:DUF3618 domain-containing protein n=1 Tax=Rhodopirellula sallentina SM41 TaxID=1263870 RepID=M5TXL1_9BACT|nr:hypothetical protein [Rhodopirellula sallentina]EMI53925.1 hypothetical protein RSSM_04672 [Rhodopirellula sallentina SM41]
MAVTTATRRQSEAIRASMREIRSELPYDVDDARERVKQLSDWKYHVSRRPLAVMAATAVLGYLVVPAKRSAPVVVRHETSAPPAEPTKRGLLGGVAGAFATLLMRQAATVAANQIATKFSAGGAMPSSAPVDSMSPHPEIRQ